MTTDTRHDELMLLHAAEAIVEAEWIRLQCDQDMWDRELAELCDPTLMPWRRPPRARTTTVRGRPATAPSQTRWWRARGCPRRRVWATQRSPPTRTRLLV